MTEKITIADNMLTLATGLESKEPDNTIKPLCEF